MASQDLLSEPNMSLINYNNTYYLSITYNILKHYEETNRINSENEGNENSLKGRSNIFFHRDHRLMSCKECQKKQRWK